MKLKINNYDSKWGMMKFYFQRVVVLFSLKILRFILIIELRAANEAGVEQHSKKKRLEFFVPTVAIVPVA